ncbi:RadC family protein [Thalassotalea mangrovi]|uniref:JAB domain-containing protein n=1 Tax=Thalassotalea mangrovi TaxID=2572245 RepID=A0A4U1B4Y7_9GAMM|nr:DNA repair protein RadC [Thalassotalea mangrovi]TKB45470.1 JAB domain-containing protein [Thalassotalea mangrovi]
MIKQLPNDERPREKLLTQGAEHLSNSELIALLFQTGSRGTDVMALSRNLLKQFGSLQALFAADAQSFCQSQGAGLAKYAQLQACLVLTRRLLQEPLSQRQALQSSTQTKHFLIGALKLEPHEVFAVLFLDNQHRVISFKKLFYGTIDAATVYPRVIVEQALKLGSCAVILSHNHPSGVVKPSLADKQITKRLVQALALIDVRVLDHIIVAGHLTYSFAECGDM